MDEYQRSRLRALQAVDEMVDGVVNRLESYGIIDNTFIFYTTDNGYHVGQHRLQPGKTCGFETDINIPLIVRGPGIQPGQVSDSVSAHVDLAPTFLNLVGAPLHESFDGRPIDLSCTSDRRLTEYVNVEYWGTGIPEGVYAASPTAPLGSIFYPNNTYKGLRLMGQGYSFYYSRWCTDETELYDLTVTQSAPYTKELPWLTDR